MAVSVRMDPLMEKELELAAKRKGVTKSQFIIEAVERALGRKDPAALYQQVMEQAATYHAADTDASQAAQPLRVKLQGKHDAEAADWLAYQQAKQRGEPWPPAGEEPAA
ncbi:CopG family transcriptional regulator [Roseateles sp.]|uniref:CopG family transcriptional regulator n=1 Tax=Roseateles sp. TaxID=1971397 RepID=UPI0032674D58